MNILPSLRFLFLVSPTLVCTVSSSLLSPPEYSPYQLEPLSFTRYKPPPSFFKPQSPYGQLEVQVFYNVNGTLRSVHFGNELHPEEVKDKPIIFWQGDPNTLYTIMMIDPDAPSRELPAMSPILHFLVVNVPGHDINKGRVMADYLSPIPPPGTRFHRYMFFLYLQTKVIKTKAPTIPSMQVIGRTNYPVREFLQKNGLLGPIGSNFFISESALNIMKAAEVGGEGGMEGEGVTTETGTVETNTAVETVTEGEPK